MKIFNLIVFMNLMTFYSASSFGDVCSSVSCPKGRTPTAICFVDPTPGERLRRASHYAACGYFTEIVVATNAQTIKEKLRQLATSCKSLDRITIKGHADDGYMSTGELDSGTVQELSPYSCLLNKNATIQFSGCNIGRGCSGDMLFYKTATSLLSKGGNIYGQTFYSSTFLPGIIPHFSLNGKYRTLNYSPNSKPPDRWSQSGLAVSDGGDINERCSENLKELIDDYSNAKVSARKKSCSLSNDYVSTERLDSYKAIQTKLTRRPPPFLEAANPSAWYDLSSALDSLKYQIRRYEQCEPPQPDNSRSRSSDAVR